MVSADEREAVALEQRRVCAVGAERLSLEDEVRDPADEVLDSGRGFRPQFQCTHVDSVYRLNQEIVKHWKMFSEASHKLLGLGSAAR